MWIYYVYMYMRLGERHWFLKICCTLFRCLIKLFVFFLALAQEFLLQTQNYLPDKHY